MENLYSTLHVAPNADTGVIKAAYRALARQYHPDVGGDAVQFHAIHNAYEVLRDPDKRKLYDFKQQEARTTIGSYIIKKELSQGGFGRVYVAEHQHTGALACVKHSLQISPQDTQLLKKEFNAIWNLRHHALPAARDFYELDDGSCAIVMSFIPGPTLEQLVESYEPKLINPEHIAWISHRMLDALRYIHFHGVVHGDVKPQNIIIQPKEHTAVLVDYGLAMIQPSAMSLAEGYTPLFAAPETRQGKPPIPETDLYCLGLTMIYGFGGDPGTKKIPHSVPQPITEFISRLIAYQPMHRPQWESEDLVYTFAQVREKAFGRMHTNMQPLEYTPKGGKK